MDWIAQLPIDLQHQIHSLVQTNPESLQVLQAVWDYKIEPKKRKLAANPEVKEEIKQEESINVPTPSSIIKLDQPILPSNVIFAISQVSFQSPLRKKMDIVFHLLEQDAQPLPVLSIVNKQVAELSVTHLSEAVKLCVLLPILGNSNTSKKNIVNLCIWLHELVDPIVCQLNLEQIKKQMVIEGKLPEEMAQDAGTKSATIGPINERIVDYFQRQFKLCGVNLVNYLPCDGLFKNSLKLHTDNAISIVQEGPDHGKVVMVEAHRGSKDGSLVFLSEGYIIFGFKKPTLLFDIKHIQHTSYSNITRLTFSLFLSVENNDTKEETLIEFGMIDQAYFQAIDDFIKMENINDNSYDDKLREKQKGAEEQEEEGQAEGEQEGDSDSEEDGDYGEGGSDSDGSGSGSETGSESGSGSEDDAGSDMSGDEEGEEADEEDDGVFHKNKEEDDN